ncbi:hypothetical protein MBLNU457_3848t1 [Dothideomycetes sp. NU457]
MPFRDHFQSLLNKAEHAMGDHNQGYSAANPPPIPTASKPRPVGAAPTGTPYWTPDLQTPSVQTNFRHETGQHGWGNAESQNYVSSPSNSFHDNSTLVVRAIIDSSRPSPSEQYTSARLTSHATLARPRGCLTAQITAPIATGIWPAFWLLPADPFVWPTDGEVDIFEAWDGDAINHSCLHWGFFNGEDWNKHRVLETSLQHITTTGQRFDFVWDERQDGMGRLIWYIDGRAVMKAEKPRGTRRMSEFRILINIAVGGNVCKGHMPRNGIYEMRIRDLAMWESGPGGWDGFERDWRSAKEGHGM